MPLPEHDPTMLTASPVQPTKSSAIASGGAFAPKPVATGPWLSQPSATTPNVAKASLLRIELSQLPKRLPDFETPGESKDSLIAQWLKHWIVDSLASGKLTENHLLPRKADLATYLGVSVGTVQNAIRFVEDEGFVESKQRIGTLLRRADAEGTRMRKQTSKRDQAVVAIQHLIVRQNIQPGEFLPSAREVAKLIGSAPNTTRLALEYLAGIGILESLGTRGNKANWLLKVIPVLEQDSVAPSIDSETLIDQLEREMKALIAERFQVGTKLPSHLELANQFKVSIKTVHDAMKRLADQGIIRSKRGRYGTYIVRVPDATMLPSVDVHALFVPVQDAGFYNYEKVEQHLKVLIARQYQPGEKLPAMGALAEQLNVSSNTVRKALQNLAQQQLVGFSRGRYGGTFVLAIPTDIDAEAVAAAEPAAGEGGAFTWVSLNPNSVHSYRSAQ